MKLLESDICGKEFEESSVNNHADCVQKKTCKFQCNICQKLFGWTGALQRHVKTVHENSKPFQCNICQEMFGQNGSLQRHLKYVHEKIKKFQCIISI